ncbi:MAG: diguanylate cyclase [Arcobacter sp.]|jgi:diguanylate cyclase (GGDEF)-like protein|uniref:GGDEF domain-containing response regulator n=1 Tax=Arcobacter sp. TaxID=1872629 RepID=UPI002588836F|nr:diguanylate cyclase [Arcobacter sp.]MDD3008537.1 diguanylate cyclase [Arcobacter sp.]MDY3204191.1 diguanylate cyclase [Arcobacter sp.]
MNKEILKDISVLYVEDENDVREFTSKLLGSLLKKVYVAQNGLEGLEIYKENQNDIDLIISDINMPKMNGLDMCEQIRKINNEMPLVITSAHNDTNFLRKAIEVGVNTYAMKPIDLYQLIESIIKAMEPILLKRKLIELNLSLESKIEQEVSKIKSILDAQDNIIIVTHNENITNVNKKFLDFFEIKDFDDFTSSGKNIFDFFQEEFGFITKEKINKQESWIQYIKDLHEIDRIVKIKNSSNEEKIFAINVDFYENKDNYYVFSLTDITKLKEKSNLLEYQASHDKLTGLFNRNRFDELYSKEIKRAKRYENNLSIILFDIDDFKNVNDNYGHQIGDEVLIEISKILLNNVREPDICVRWGGEEFLILLPQTNLEGAKAVAEKIRVTIIEKPLTEKNLPISASFGVCQMDENDGDFSLISKSDKLLYLAKKSGKNIVIAQ